MVKGSSETLDVVVEPKSCCLVAGLKSLLAHDLVRHMLIHFSLWLGVILYIVICASILMGIEGDAQAREEELRLASNYSGLAPPSIGRSAVATRPLIPDFKTSCRFIYGVITATGTGQMSPTSPGGKWLTILIALPGIPLALLALADIGKFLLDAAISFLMNLMQKKEGEAVGAEEEKVGLQEEGLKEKEEAPAGDPPSDAPYRAVILLVAFFLYLFATMSMMGDEFPSGKFYTSFMMVTTMSLEDLFVARPSFPLAISLLHITTGIVIITMCIEAASDAFKKIHYLGAKIKEVATVPVWFGGRKVYIRGILTPISKKYEIPMGDLNSLVALAAEGKEWEPTPPPTPKPVLLDDLLRIFGDDGSSFAETDSLEDL